MRNRTALLVAGILLVIGFALPLHAQTVTYTHNLTWQDNSDNEDGFKIERKQGPTGAFAEIAQVNAGVTSYQDVLMDGLKRCYRLRAFNASGESEFSNESCNLPKPAKPGTLTITTTTTTTTTTMITP